MSLIWNVIVFDVIFVEDGDVFFELCFDVIGDLGSFIGISFNVFIYFFLLENVEGIEFILVNGGVFIQGFGGLDDVIL